MKQLFRKFLIFWPKKFKQKIFKHFGAKKNSKKSWPPQKKYMLFFQGVKNFRKLFLIR